MDLLLSTSNPPAYEHPPQSGHYSAVVRSQDLLRLLRLPEIQRELDPQWVDTLQEKLVSFARTHGYFDFGRLELGAYKDCLYLLNGQHRYHVLQRISDDYPNICVEIKIRSVTDLSQLNDWWMIVNGSKPVEMCRSTDFQI